MSSVPVPVYPGLPRPLVLGHRGACRYAPENTWESFDLAVRLGADVLETDVHLTRDGEVIVLHDATLGRTTEAHGFAKTHSYSELAKLDAGYHFRSDAGELTFRGQGVKIPRLEDMLRAFPHTSFNIEVKQYEPSAVAAVLQVLERAGPTAPMLLAAGDHRIMVELEASNPGCALGLSSVQAQAVVKGSYWGGIPRALNSRALQIPTHYRGLPLVTRRLLRAAQKACVDVHIWTINTPRAAHALFKRGVQGIVSDDPGAILEVAAPWRQRHHERTTGRSFGGATDD